MSPPLGLGGLGHARLGAAARGRAADLARREGRGCGAPVQVGAVTSACQDAEGEWVGLAVLRSRQGDSRLDLEGEDRRGPADSQPCF
jgi:hypothetical protein